MEYLAFWVVRKHIRLLNKILEIKNMIPLTTPKGDHKFIGSLNYHCDIWGRRFHRLHTLTNLLFRKVKF